MKGHKNLRKLQPSKKRICDISRQNEQYFSQLDAEIHIELTEMKERKLKRYSRYSEEFE